jgi:hypothetical protein
MKNAALLAFLAIIGVVLIIAMFKQRPPVDTTAVTPAEGFSNIGSAFTPNFRPEYTNEREAYIEKGKAAYNDMGGIIDISRGNFARANDPKSIEETNKALRDITITTALETTPDSPTSLGTHPVTSRVQIPKTNNVLENARRCEALKGRDRCSVLGTADGKDCGICVKGGTRYEDDVEGQHIGGLYVMPDDIELAKIQGKPVQPTLGECPPGHFFIDRAACEKQVNRLDCAESGETGGFTGRTAEGKQVALAKCAMSSQAGFEKVMIYEPKERSFDALLRFVTPTGTGRCTIQISYNGATKVNQTFDKPGTEQAVQLPGVKEGMSVDIRVTLESLHRPSGNPEVFNFRGAGTALYPYSREEAVAACSRIGTRIATEGEVAAAQRVGAQLCETGWTSDSRTGIWPAQATHKNGICGTAGINRRDRNGLANAWCFGVKPPKAGNDGTAGKPYVGPFFKTYGAESTPSQEELPDQWSQHGDYTAPAYRAIVMQWEMMGDPRTRSTGFEPTIIKVNGQDPTNIAGDGTRTFKVLRRFGTYRTSRTIMFPKPAAGTPMLTNQFWIWGPVTSDPTLTLTALVPGILDNPFYAEDQNVAGVTRGPLLGRPTTAALLRVGPCLREDQEAGKYSSECLSSLFLSAGGDPLRGLLAIENGGLSQLNKYGDMDNIGMVLSNLFTVATTGRDSGGNLVGGDAESRRRIINNASQLMFGFDIASPCEEVGQDARGDVIIKVKDTPDIWCLDYLWTNTGSDKSRGAESAASRSLLKNTYVNIGDRYSGLRKDEGSLANRKQFPFTTCTRGGSMAPLDGTGTRNEVAIRTALSRGNIQAIQDFYDAIFQQANASTMSRDPEAMASHARAMKRCFGLDRSPNKPPKCPRTFDLDTAFGQIVPTPMVAQPAAVAVPPPPPPPPVPIQCPHGNKAGIAVAYKQDECLPPPPPPPPPPVPVPEPPRPAGKVGVPARYVRVLRSFVFRPQDQPCLQIPQIQMFDNTEEIAEKRFAWARNEWQGNDAPAWKAVNGNKNANSHPNEYHDRSGFDLVDEMNNWWQIDLNRMHNESKASAENNKNITSIKFNYRLDCCTWRQIAAPLVFLDTNGKVTGIRYLWTNSIPRQPTIETMDILPTVKSRIWSRLIENNKDNIYDNDIILGTGICLWRYLRHAGYVCWAHGPDGGFPPNDREGLPPSYSQLQQWDSGYKVIPARSGQPWPYFSLQNLHPSFRNWCIQDDGSGRARIFNGDSDNRIEQTLKFVPSLNGDPSGISIMKCRRGTAGNGFVRIYQHCDYGGYMVELKPGRYNFAAMQRLWPWRNDDISSITIHGNVRAVLWEHDLGQGHKLEARSNIGCFVDRGFNDVMSSIEVFGEEVVEDTDEYLVVNKDSVDQVRFEKIDPRSFHDQFRATWRPYTYNSMSRRDPVTF